ncbi:hypothetical protein HD806DRAFT_552055 [Xylariaceae sp. AK1471]|nr:hypothetical protein HD806DRAFT_552055 [Xylariaceae sp. AK1471]
MGPLKDFISLLLVAASNAASPGNFGSAEIALPVIETVPPPPLITGCLNVSFIAPSWIVENFYYEDNDEASFVTMGLSSNALQARFNCSVKTPPGRHLLAGACGGEDGEQKYPPQISFDTGGDLYVDHTWSCLDNEAKVPVNFMGSGVKTLPLECDDDYVKCTAPGPVRIPAILTEPIGVTPYIPPTPAGHDTPGCTKRSRSPSWKITGFEWWTGGRNFTWTLIGTASGISGLGMAKLNLTNEANQQRYSCTWQSENGETSNITVVEVVMNVPIMGQLMYPMPEKSLYYRCETAHSLDENTTERRNYETITSMRLISSENRLLINQTWYCDDEGAQNPIQFHGSGSVDLPSLHCRERLKIESEAEISNITSVFVPVTVGTPVINGSVCTGPEFTIKGKIESEYPMEPFALELPSPTTPMCTADSFHPDKQYFRLDTTSPPYMPLWEYNGPNSSFVDELNRPTGRFTLDAFHFVSGLDFLCQASSSKLNPNQTNFDPDFWCDCPVSPYMRFIRTAKANYNVKTGDVSLSLTWACDELSPGNPIIFTALGSTNIGEPECRDEEVNDPQRYYTRCTFYQGTVENQRMPFKNITWREPFGN